jgi:hypothetical protein
MFLYFVGILVRTLDGTPAGRLLNLEEALGFGDVNLSGVLGLVLGWPLIIPGLDPGGGGRRYLQRVLHRVYAGCPALQPHDGYPLWSLS